MRCAAPYAAAATPFGPCRVIEGRRVDLPLALLGLNRSMEVGARVVIRIEPRPPGMTGRTADLVEGAGFELLHAARDGRLTIERRLSIPDSVGPEMQVLISGLNPSLHAAEMGIGFGRAGNRFWPAALSAGLVSVDRDPVRALEYDRVGMTDIVKRATRRAAEISAAEYESGLGRLARLVAWLEPAILCMVGLAGYRAVIDRDAKAGLQEARIGGRPVYLMPSTSGLNAHSRLADLTAHLGEVAQLAAAERSSG